MKRPTCPEKLPKPFKIVATLLFTVFVIEAAVMFLLPHLLPGRMGILRDLLDALLLASLSAPFIWVLVARPLRAAAESEMTRARAALDYLVEAVIDFDRQGTIESINPAAERMFGYRSADLTGRKISELIPDADAVLLCPACWISTDDRFPGARHEAVGLRGSGERFPLEISISPLRLQGRSTRIAIIHDITERKRMEAHLCERKEFAENLVRNSVIPTFVIGPDHRVLLWNRACEELTGIKSEAMLASDEPWKALFGRKRTVLAEMVVDGVMEAPGYYGSFARSSLIPDGLVAEEWCRNMNGHDRYLLLNAAPIRNGSGELLAAIETVQDITERKRYEEQLEYQASHDQLTGLPNRNLLGDRIRQALLGAGRNRHQVAVMFVDLDFFKIINDTLGHDSGDEVLKVVAGRLEECMRRGDTVARQGGDEFVIVVSDRSVAACSARIADKVRQVVAEPIKVNGQELVVTGSIGISVHPRDGEDAQTLMRNADVAMYRAKELGRNNFQFYAEEMNRASLAHLTMERHLRRALERNELSLHFQPKVSTASGLVTGMEALLRWNSSELGMVSPATFIPLAEETGLIGPIGEWVLRTACSRNRAWQDAGLPPIQVATNLSARQFRQTDVVDLVRRTLDETGLDPRFLELEITESLIMQDSDGVQGKLNQLKEMGVSLAMDDFGTGYSSLSYLNRLPFDKLKIDLSFVRDITSNPNSAAIARTIIAMAHSLHLKVIAEGVETGGQLNYLRDLKCDEIQGYYFSRPLPAAEFEKLLREGRRLESGGEEPPVREKTILVVDDDENVVSMLKRLLALEGFRVLAAGSAEEGFELLANHRVGVVLSDQWMPGMKGSEFLGRVSDLYPQTVRILVSGNADLESVAAALNKGSIYKFLAKPWHDDQFRDVIQNAFSHYEQQNIGVPFP